ncbi:tetratricopeptide repeat protein [Sphingobium sp. R-7]|uniref:tetratricopeptide repeat protein n=1 Tax=Sphingobium sp. R-7 TaxID=3375449 RepID=UPI00398A5596
MCDLSMPLASAKASWEKPASFRPERITAPKRGRTFWLSVFPETLGTEQVIAAGCIYIHGIYGPFFSPYPCPSRYMVGGRMRLVGRLFAIIAVSVCSLVHTHAAAEEAAASAEMKTVAMARRAYFAGRYEEARSVAYDLAVNGDPEAQMLMGQMLKEGKARSPNYVEAVKWIRLAADQGNSFAQIDMALSYRQGRGVPKSIIETANWFRRSALNGNPVAQDQLGRLYVSGRGVPESMVGAYAWLAIAAAQGWEESKKAVELIEKEMPQDQLATAQKMADDCLQSNYTSCNW